MINTTLKELLLQYNDIKKEITKVENTIKKLESKGYAKDCVETSMNKPPFEKVSLTITGINYEIMQKVEKYKNLKQARLNRLLDVKICIEEFIQQIPESRMRQIIEHKCFDGYSWQKIAYIVGGTENSVRMDYKRFFEKK